MEDKNYLDESQSGRMMRKLKKNPFLLIGMTGFLVTAAIGAYKFKSRPKGMPIPLFLVQLRVAAQSAVVGTLTVGVVYGMIDKYILNKKEDN